MSTHLVPAGSAVPAPPRRRIAPRLRPFALGLIVIAIGTPSESPAAVEQTVATTGGACGATLTGTFACKDLRSLDGSEPRDLLGGAFDCRVD